MNCSILAAGIEESWRLIAKLLPSDGSCRSKVTILKLFQL